MLISGSGDLELITKATKQTIRLILDDLGLFSVEVHIEKSNKKGAHYRCAHYQCSSLRVQPPAVVITTAMIKHLATKGLVGCSDIDGLEGLVGYQAIGYQAIWWVVLYAIAHAIQFNRLSQQSIHEVNNFSLALNRIHKQFNDMETFVKTRLIDYL
jgi:hypothetical protein